MTARRLVPATSVLVMLAVALPVGAQGKGGNGHGKPVAPPPTSTSVPTATAGTAATATAPFAWMDDANLLAPGAAWLGVSMVQWHGGGASEVVVPVFDGSVGLTPRVQVGVSVPRVAGGLGTTFFTAKIGLFTDEARGLKVAVGPTLEVLSPATIQSGPAGQGRVQWGFPVSIELDREVGRIYASSGYFSPGVWYGGGAIGWTLSNRLSASLSFSRAWTNDATVAGAPAIGGPRRNDLSGGGSFDVTPTIALFGSVGRTIATAARNGAGTTLSVGLSLSTAPGVFAK
jgi:hypothetical protein